MSEKDEVEGVLEAWLGDVESEDPGDAFTRSLDHLYASGPGSERTSQAQDLIRKSISDASAQSLFYDVLRDSPVGPIYIGVDEKGVVVIKIDISEADFISEVEKKYKKMIRPAPEKVADVKGQLHEYFDGKRSSFSLNLNLENLSQFQQKVLRATLEVPHGEITTYGEIATRLGKSRLARAVGQALARNPIPIVIPCHRVLSADGSLRGYSGGRGLETKSKLLRLEGAY